MAVAALARNPIIDVLNGLEWPIYLRLIDAWNIQGSPKVMISNRALYADNRTAIRVLHQLEQKGLIRLHYDGKTPTTRTIEVLR